MSFFLENRIEASQGGGGGQTAPMYVLLMTGTGMFHNPVIHAFEDNPASCVSTGGIGNMLSTLDS